MFCGAYVGVACVDGSCPTANKDEYIERGMDVVWSCRECSFYKGCVDCALSGTQYCEKNAKGN